MIKNSSDCLSVQADNLLGLDELNLEPVISKNINNTLKNITGLIDHNYLAQEGFVVSELQLGIDLFNPNKVNPEIKLTLSRKEND